MNIEPNTFICADSIEVLREIKDKAFDLCLTDPPYGVGLEYRSYQDTVDNLDCIIGALSDMRRVSKLVVLTPGVKNMFKWPEPDHAGVYYYPSSPCFSNWGTCLYQPIYYYGKDPHVGKLMPDSFMSYEVSEKIGHPCPKPLKQWMSLVLRTSKPGDLIIDPFCGSGTTALACHKTGRRFLCIDKDEEYIKIAQQRYADLIAQQDLFGQNEDGAQNTSEGRGTACNSASMQVALDI
jgi:site-specific DNA-methyltransferase (adenine-specific)